MSDTDGRGLRISVEADWACAWIKAEGDVVDRTAPELRRAIDEVLRRRHRKVHLFLSGVSVIDPTGAGMLAEARRCAKQRGTKLVVHSPARAVRQNWRVTTLRYLERLRTATPQPERAVLRLLDQPGK